LELEKVLGDMTFQQFLTEAERSCEWSLRENASVDFFRDDYFSLDNEEEMALEKGNALELPVTQC
jgi:hypothetical protein